MRWVVFLIALLLAGCSSEPTEGTDDVDDAPDGPDGDDGHDTGSGGASNDTVAPAIPVYHEILYEDAVELKGSAATGYEDMPWVTGYPTDFDIPDSSAFTGILLEIAWDAPTGGVVGGAAGYWAQDIADDGLSSTTLGEAHAAGGETGRAWVSAQDLASADGPEFYVSGGDGPHHAAYGTATVVASAFFNGEPDGEFSALP